jgi:hypothetical protein
MTLADYTVQADVQLPGLDERFLIDHSSAKGVRRETRAPNDHLCGK